MDIVRWALSGNCLVYPTSTLPALGCIPTTKSLDDLYRIKKRSAMSPVSLGVTGLSQASEIVEIPDDVPEILESFPEGSLTIVLKAIEKMDERLGGFQVAVRVVTHPVAKKLLGKTGPLTATSANLSGEEPMVDCLSAAENISTPEFPIEAVEGLCQGGLPSTLIAWHTVCDTPESMSIEVIREGKISSEEVYSWWRKRI